MPADPVLPAVERVRPRAAKTTPPGIAEVDESWVNDVDAFARMYDETSARVYGVVLRVVRDPAQAEEVTQEVYFEFWRQAGRYEAAPGTALSWLVTIAHGRAVDRVRSVAASRRRDLSDYEQQCRVMTFDETSEAVERLQSARVVRDALSALNMNQRRAIELAYFCGHSRREVSQLLGIPVGTAKTRIRTGLTQLRGSLEGV